MAALASREFVISLLEDLMEVTVGRVQMFSSLGRKLSVSMIVICPEFSRERMVRMALERRGRVDLEVLLALRCP